MGRPINRHEFIESVTRGGLIAGLLGVGAAALHGTREVSECFNHNYCDSCFAFQGCSLPQKKEVKDERAQEIRPA